MKFVVKIVNNLRNVVRRNRNFYFESFELRHDAIRKIYKMKNPGKLWKICENWCQKYKKLGKYGVYEYESSLCLNNQHKVLYRNNTNTNEKLGKVLENW